MFWEGDVVSRIISVNVHRRHLEAADRIRGGLAA